MRADSRQTSIGLCRITQIRSNGELDMRSMTRMLAAAIITLSVCFAGCHKGGSEAKQVTPEEAKKNAELEKTAPHLAPTVLGSVERINLAITAATNGYKEHKW